jgi:hypothetical protein
MASSFIKSFNMFKCFSLSSKIVKFPIFCKMEAKSTKVRPTLPSYRQFDSWNSFGVYDILRTRPQSTTKTGERRGEWGEGGGEGQRRGWEGVSGRRRGRGHME